MADRPRSTLRDYLAYLVVRMLVCALQAMPFTTACGCARALAWLIYHLDKRHRQVARDNLGKAFPGRFTEAEIDSVVRGVYRHFCTVIVEIAHFPRRIHVHNWKRHGRLIHAERIMQALLADRPLLVVTGHYGNWEMAGYLLGLVGFRTHAIARPLDNPYLDEYLRSFRERTGQKLLAKHGEFDKIQDVLAGGGVIATLGDQDAGPRGLFVDFFQRPASTHKAIALMAMQHQALMAPIGAPKLQGRYQVIAADVIQPEDYEDAAGGIRAITQRFTTDLESLIRMAPEQYFWVHRRWKHQPQERKKKQAA